MTARSKSLLEGDVAPHIRRLAWPMVWGLLSLSLFSVIDTVFIAKLGTKYLAALGFTIPLVMFYLGVIFGLSVGTTSALARAYGEGGIDKLRHMSADAIVLAAIITCCAAVIGFLTIDPVFRLMGAKEDLLPLIHRYMAIWYCGLPFFGVMLIGNSCVRATGDTRFPSMVMIFMSALNIALDPFFIFGWGPFPRLELAGAAVTLVTAYYITCAVSLYVLIFRRKAVAMPRWGAEMFATWKKILHVGVPSMISNQIAPLSAAIITWMAADFGKEAVAALGVASRIEGICTLVFYAIGAGVSIFTGQNYGAGNHGRVAEAARAGGLYALMWGTLVAVLLWPFAYDIPNYFDDNATVIAYTAQYLHWVPITFGALGYVIIVNASLNAMGKPFAATVLIMLRAVVVYVPMAYVFQERMGFSGIIMAMALTNLVVGGISWAYSRKLNS